MTVTRLIRVSGILKRFSDPDGSILETSDAAGNGSQRDGGERRGDGGGGSGHHSFVVVVNICRWEAK
jgi:hypothetical protein